MAMEMNKNFENVESTEGLSQGEEKIVNQAAKEGNPDTSAAKDNLDQKASRINKRVRQRRTVPDRIASPRAKNDTMSKIGRKELPKNLIVTKEMEEFTSQEDGMTSIDLSSFTGTDDISKRKNTMIANKLIKGLTDSGKINRVKPVDVSLKINTTGVDNPTAILLSALGESAQEGNVTIETKDNTPEENAIVIHKVVKNILPFLVAQGQANLAIKIDQNTLDQVKDPDDKKNLADFIEKGLIQPTASPDA